MPLVSSKEVLQKAMSEGYAVGAFNVNNGEMVQAIAETAQEEQAPVILQISQGAIKYAGLEFATAMVKTVAELATVPVVLHLDHGTDFDQNVKCLRVGFTSLMYDGSATPLEDNIRVTSKITEIAHAVDIPVESELGKIPKIEDYQSMLPAGYDYSSKLPADVQENVENLMADPEQAERFVEKTQCDSLAVAVGSVHGMKRAVQPLNIERLDSIRRRCGIPMVLHGASGVICTHDQAEEFGIKLNAHEGTIEDAVKHGISKINVATELSMEFIRGIKNALDEKPGEKDMRKILLPGKQLVKEKVRYYMHLFGCAGKGAAAGVPSGITSSEIKYHE